MDSGSKEKQEVRPIGDFISINLENAEGLDGWKLFLRPRTFNGVKILNGGVTVSS